MDWETQNFMLSKAITESMQYLSKSMTFFCRNSKIHSEIHMDLQGILNTQNKVEDSLSDFKITANSNQNSVVLE